MAVEEMKRLWEPKPSATFMQNNAPVQSFSSREFVGGYLGNALAHLGAFLFNDAVDNSLSRAIDLLDKCRRNNGTIFTIGNGGSASTASHLCADLNKWATGDGKIPTKAVCLLDNVSAMTALTNDNGWDNVYIEQLKNFGVTSKDCIVGFSVHGGKGQDKAGQWSQNLTKAIAYVKEKGGSSIGITGFDGGAMKGLCDVNINIPANSTPHVEGFHVVVHHCLVDGLRVIAGGRYEEK